MAMQRDEKFAANPSQHLDAGINFTIPPERFGAPIPFVGPNVSKPEDLLQIVNKQEPTSENLKCCCAVLCGLSGIGLCYLCCVQKLIDQGEYGFANNNGQPEILLPGRHLLLSPLNRFMSTKDQKDDFIEQYPVTIIRVPVGSLALAQNNAHPEILLPGLHARSDGNWRTSKATIKKASEEVIDYGPIKFLTVKSGTVRVCYLKGKVHIFEEGRYAVNDPTFVISGIIQTQQQNLPFTDHMVLLDGGISMLIRGLLTFQVVDVERLIKKLGDRDLARALEDVCQAEMSRVFSGIHLEQISSSFSSNSKPENKDSKDGKEGKQDDKDVKPESRSHICSQIIAYITPTAKEWGAQIVNFQLESLKLADAKYARDYEEASLAMAKAKANLRSVNAENDILLNKANAQAQAAKIEAEGKKMAMIIKAQGEAEARKIEADARNKAAQAMSDPFAKQFAMAGQQVEFARALKANVLTVLPDSALGKPFVAQSMFANNSAAQLQQ